MNQQYYSLNIEDFKRAFKFGTEYYIDPKKNTTGRTTSEPRGLGAILDNFTLGKLTEIGIEKIFKSHTNTKDFVLDFNIKKNVEVMTEPDIGGVVENSTTRLPNCFVEIKNISESGRWIGLTEEQFNTIKRSANSKNIYLIYASISSDTIEDNPKTADLTGMFLKEIENKDKSKIFQVFADLNAKCRIEFILTDKELEDYSFAFERGMNFYETKLFQETKSGNVYNALKESRKDVQTITPYLNYKGNYELFLKKKLVAENKLISEFFIEGSFNIIEKKSSTIIECLTDVKISNSIFGTYRLTKEHFYNFNLNTVGRDPKLKRNNMFIAKRRVLELIEEGKIAEPSKVIKEIVNQI